MRDGKVIDIAAYADFFVYSASVGIPSILLTLYLLHVSRSEARRAAAAPAKLPAE